MEKQDQLNTIKILSCFPTETWLMILQHVDTAVDYLNISASCVYLRTNLQPRKTTMLLSETVGKRLMNSNIIPLRGVCSAWKNSIDKSLQELIYERFAPRLLPRFITQLKQTTNFAKYKVTIDCTPFIASVVIIDAADVIDRRVAYSFYRELTEMLSNHGHHIHYCHMSVFIPHDSADTLRLIQNLATCLKRMPNLQELILKVRGGYRITSVISEVKFPTLKNLRRVTQSEVPTELFQSVLESNPQITKLSSHRSTSDQVRAYLEELPQLTHLCIEAEISEDEFETLSHCGVLCHLTTLEINMQYLQVPWEDVFLVLSSQFGKTLENLKIKLPNNKHNNVGFSTMQFSKLKTLWMEMQHPAVLDFLLPVKDTLKKLEMYFRQSSPYDLIKVYHYGLHIHKYNIWKISGRLNIIDIRSRSCYGCKHFRKKS